MSDFLSFRTMITPYIVQIIFWLGTLACVVTGIGMFLGSSDSAATGMVDFGGPTTKFAGLLIIILGPLFVRIWCELLIVLFRIHSSLVSIEHQGRPNTAA